MNRKEFLKTCGGACLGMLGVSYLQACTAGKQVLGKLNAGKLLFEKNVFVYETKKGKAYRKNIITRVDSFNYPIVIYRFSESDYSAVLLCCSHQQNELSVHGDVLSCSAHGSEFTTRGEVLLGPAEQNLKQFTIEQDDKNIYLLLS